MKPEKYTIFEYYVVPIIQKLKSKLGYWYCSYCNKEHSPRTKKYSGRFTLFAIKNECSLGLKTSDEEDGNEISSR